MRGLLTHCDRTSQDPSELLGKQVVVKGLLATPELNGSSGRVLEYIESMGRYRVEIRHKLLGTTSLVALLPDNIQVDDGYMSTLKTMIDVEEIQRNICALRVTTERYFDRYPDRARVFAGVTLVALMFLLRGGGGNASPGTRSRLGADDDDAPLASDLALWYALGYSDASRRKPHGASLNNLEDAVYAFSEEDEDHRDILEEVLTSFPAEAQGIRDEWAKQTGWHRREDTTGGRASLKNSNLNRHMKKARKQMNSKYADL